jgi:hypothetical protein
MGKSCCLIGKAVLRRTSVFGNHKSYVAIRNEKKMTHRTSTREDLIHARTGRSKVITVPIVEKVYGLSDGDRKCVANSGGSDKLNCNIVQFGG